MLREDEAPERGVDLDRGPRGDILEDDDPERDEEPEIESKQTNAQVWCSGEAWGRCAGISKLGPTLADRQKEGEFVVHIQSLSWASQLYSSLYSCSVSSHFLHRNPIPASVNTPQNSQFPLLLLPSKLLSRGPLSSLFTM